MSGTSTEREILIRSVRSLEQALSMQPQCHAKTPTTSLHNVVNSLQMLHERTKNQPRVYTPSQDDYPDHVRFSEHERRAQSKQRNLQNERNLHAIYRPRIQTDEIFH